jgi:hypothetical protein
MLIKNREAIEYAYSAFCAGLKRFHLPNFYCVTASIHSSNTHALRESGGEEDSQGDFESNTLERLRDGQIKLGADI